MAIQTVTLPSTNDGSTRRLRRARRSFQEAYAHQKQRHWQEAADGFTNAIKCDPANAFPALANRGICYEHLGRPRDALDDYARAMQLGTPEQQKLIRVNRGVLYGRVKRYAEALEDFASDGSRESLLNAAYIHLAHGAYEKGLALYRVRQSAEGRPLYTLDQLAGKSVLILHEQGYGDSIQMARFVPDVARVAKSVHWATRTVLMPLLSMNFHNVQFSDGDDVKAAALAYQHDVTVPVMDLWQCCGLKIEGKPYLHTAGRTIGVSIGNKPRIGISWRGRTSYANDHSRSMPLETLKPLREALPTAEFVSLQKDLRPEETESSWFLDGGSMISNFADSAAMIAGLDALVTVDTATAHLAGALGVKTAILLPYACDWRWGIEGDTTPWYDSARLFRQPTYGAWTPAVEAAAAWLK